jgi:pimeloyl-ACP methyl ester carboxylesterase
MEMLCLSRRAPSRAVAWVLMMCAAALVMIAGCSDDSDTARSTRLDVVDTGAADSTGDAADIPDGPFVIDGVLGPDGQPLTGKPLGMACADTAECRLNLSCGADQTCQPQGDAAAGALCVLSAECAPGLACGLTARCEPSEGAAADQACDGSSDCAPGLRCALAGFAGVCAPEGGAEIGEACAAHSDCRAPLACGENGKCAIPALGGFAFPPPVVCADDTPDTFTALFRLPNAATPDSFYDLPFPNDALRKGTGIDLSAHPNPGTRYLGGDLIGAYISALASDTPGFSQNATVFMRFSQAINFNSVKAGSVDGQNMYFVNITPGEGYGRGSSLGWFVTTGRGKYVCQNYMTVRAPWSQPLDPGQTYAVFLTQGITSETGKPLTRDADFDAVMGAARPADPAQAAAWDAYAPLRAFLADDVATPTVSADQVLTAAVFTTQDPKAAMDNLRQAVDAEAAPQLTSFARCEPGQPSPCGDGRTCAPASDAYVELHGRYSAPIWQAGTRPYLTAGGGLSPDPATAPPTAQGREDLCVVVTVPKSPDMPAAGWPVVLYAHGTGGDAQSHLRDGTALAVSAVTTPSAADPVRFMTMAVDAPQHMQRRGGATLDPETLFYNFANPLAARGNVYQAAADYLYLLRLASSLSLAADASPTGEALAIDPAQVHMFGHSQGGTVAALLAPHVSALQSAVLSGAGGGLTLSLLQKTAPVNIAAATQFILNDGIVGDNHPILQLLQTWFDAVDPLNHARYAFRAPDAAKVATDILMSLGAGDSYTPQGTAESLAAALSLQHAQPAGVVIDPNFIRPIDLPASGNRGVNGDDATAVLISFQPAAGDDGHFVMQRLPEAIRKYTQFFATAARDGRGVVP